MVADNIIFNFLLVEQSDGKGPKYGKPKFAPTKEAWIEKAKAEAMPVATEIMTARIKESTR